MSSTDSKASSASDVSSTEILGTIAIKGHQKRRRMMTNKELTGAARKKTRTQLVQDPKPTVKSSMIDPSVARLAQSDDDSLEEGHKVSNLPSSKPLSMAGLIQRPPAPPRLRSTNSSEAVDLAGLPRVTDVPAFLSKTPSSKTVGVELTMQSIKAPMRASVELTMQSIKAPRRASRPRKPPRKQLMHNPRIPIIMATADDSPPSIKSPKDASKHSPLDDDDGMENKPPKKSSCRPPLDALPRTYESDSGDEDVLDMKWPQQRGSQRIMPMPYSPGQKSSKGIETTDSAALADAAETLTEPLLIPHSVVEDLGVNDGKKKRRGRGKNKVSTEPKEKVPKEKKANNPKTVKPPATKRVRKPALKTGIVRSTDGFYEHSFMNTIVCFSLSGPYDLLPYIGDIPECAKVILENEAYIYGSVAPHKDNGRYTIEWENTDLKRIVMESEGVFHGVQLAKANAPLRLLLDNATMKVTAQQSFKEFIHAFDDNDNPMEIELDSDGEEDVTMDPTENTPKSQEDEAFPRYASIPPEQHFQFDMTHNMKHVESSTYTAPENIHNITWRRDIELPEHPQKSGFGATKVKPEAISKFDTPINSLLAFLPIPIWETMVEYSNINAQQKKDAHPRHWISGHPWKKDLCLEELMTFFSIMFEMTLHPTPGREYSHMWTKQTFYPFTTSMSITRFRQIRSVIHLNNNECHHTSNKDSLVRIRPMLNVLKRTLGSFLDVGDELCIDEASIASKSKFGRGFICYNPMKPGGKYHYRFYFVCESDHYNLTRFTMHTKMNVDLADGFNTSLNDDITDNEDDAIPESLGNEDDELSDDDVDDVTPAAEPLKKKKKKRSTVGKIGRLINDLLTPYEHTYRTVNMDRFYGGPQQAVAMLQKGILSRATFKTNRKLAPHSVRFTKPETDNSPRGCYRMAVAVKEHMSVFGWNDNCPVHMISTADGTLLGSVQRQVKAVAKMIKAPVVVPRYNKGMQGVDRHDQLRNLFALTQRHQFQKYYMTLIMGLIDFALVNANIHYHMVHPALKKRNDHRAVFMQSLCLGLRSANWRQLQEAHYRGMGSKVSEQTLYEGGPHNPHVRRMLGLEKPAVIPSPDSDDLLCRHVSSPLCNPRSCLDMGMSKAITTCDVCLYEGRGRKYLGTYCYKHASRTCVGVQENSHKAKSLRLGGSGTLIKIPSGMDYSTWLCPYPELTCWEKHHQFYMKHDVFTVVEVDGVLPLLKVNRTAIMYKERNKFIRQCRNKYITSSPNQYIPNQEIPRRISPRRRLLIHNTTKPSMNGREHRSGAVTSPAYQSTTI